MPTLQQDTTPWTQAAGRLTPRQQAAAQASYERWHQAQVKRGRAPAQIFDYDAYVSYVQDRPTRPTSSRYDNTAFARQTYRDQEPGFNRRRRFLADLLARHYDRGHLDPSVAAHIRHIELNRSARTATLHLVDGTRLVDHGDRISHHGPVSALSAAEIAAAAARHGWTRATLTGSDEFKDEVTIALALLEPAISTDHTLSPAATARLAAALAARGEVNSIASGHEADADIAAGAADDVDQKLGVASAVVIAGAGRDDDDNGSGGSDAADDELRAEVVTWLGPRVATARDLLASRPAVIRGSGRAARRSQERAAEFDARDATAYAKRVIATHDALTGPEPNADLLDAVRRTGNMTAAQQAMQDRATQQQQQQPEFPTPDGEPDRPRI